MADQENFKEPEEQTGPEPQETGRDLMPWEPSPGQQMQVASTLPGKETLIHMNDTIEATELKDKPAKIQHVIVHAATVVDESGSESDVRRVVLVDTKGVAYACVSEGVISSIQQLAAVFGAPPWDLGINLRLIEKKTRRGFRVYRLIPA